MWYSTYRKRKHTKSAIKMAVPQTTASNEEMNEISDMPLENTDIIINKKKDMEKQDFMNKGRKCVNRLCNYYNNLKQYKSFPGDWDICTLEDICGIVSNLVNFGEFINEDWFKEHHDIIFKNLLKDIQTSSSEYAKSCIIRTGTISEQQRKFIDSVNEKLLKPLNEMRKLTSVRRPYYPGHMSSRDW